MFVLLCRLALMVGGVAGGYELGLWLRLHYFDDIWTTGSITFFVLSLVLCLAIAFLLGGIIGRFLARILNSFIKYIKDTSGTEILFGSFGILLGYIFAAIPAVFIYTMLGGYSAWIPALCCLIIFLAAGSAGYITAVQKKDDFINLFKSTGSRHGLNLDTPDSTKIIDTSTIIDGRLLDISKTGFISGKLIIPRFVLKEIQGVADSSDAIKRNRGRRGMEILSELQDQRNVEVFIEERNFPDIEDVDSKLVALTKSLNGMLVTVDFNLGKVAQLQGVEILNINELASAIKPVYLPGERFDVKIVKDGKEPGQGVGYLADGTMVVVDGGKKSLGNEIGIEVTSILQTPAGRMIFASPTK